MNTRHVPDLEHCQELDRLCKEKGIVVPETEFYWKVGKASGHANLTTDKPDLENWTKTDDGFDWYHAPLVSEQGEFLPDELADEHQDLPYFLTAEKRADPDYWIVYYGGARGELSGTQFEGNTEANARQKSINYLLAEGIITTL
jgi:hypothetical protein